MKILLAIDGSKFSEAATQAVVGRTPAKDTEVAVLHVVQPPAIVVGDEARAFPTDLEAMQREQLKEAETVVGRAGDLLRSLGFKVTTLVDEGDPVAKIVDHAAAWKADLIVLGSHGRKGLGRFLLGSVSEGVARHAPCTVEIVRVPAGVATTAA